MVLQLPLWSDYECLLTIWFWLQNPNDLSRCWEEMEWYCSSNKHFNDQFFFLVLWKGTLYWHLLSENIWNQVVSCNGIKSWKIWKKFNFIIYFCQNSYKSFDFLLPCPHRGRYLYDLKKSVKWFRYLYNVNGLMNMEST